MSWAGRNNAKITNQFTAGGSAKAGLGRHIGMGQFIYLAIVNGAAVDAGAAPPFAGTSWNRAFTLGRVPTTYPNPRTNQLGGVHGRWMGMTRTPADGFIESTWNDQNARIRLWYTRGW